MEFLLRKLDPGGEVGVLLDSRGPKDAALSRDLVRVAKSFGVWVYLILEALARWRAQGRARARSGERTARPRLRDGLRAGEGTLDRARRSSKNHKRSRAE